MNELETKEYLEKLQQLKLSDASRARIQDTLIQYARFHGVRADEESRLIVQVPQRTPLLTLFKQPKSMTAALIAIALIAGGGTSYAAQTTVPGDFLYPVKIEVNETVRSAFTFSNEAEAELQADLANERLEEAETLATRGALNADTSAQLGAQIKSHYDEAMARSATAEAKGDYEASAAVRASLEGSFRTYAAVLAELSGTIPGNSSDTLITEIQTYADTAADTQIKASSTIDASSSDTKAEARATINNAERFIAQVTARLAWAKNDLSSESYARTEAKFAQVLVLQAEAETSFEAGAYAEAYRSAQAALRMAHEVETMIDSQLRLEIDLDLGTDSVVDIDVHQGENQNPAEEEPEPKEDKNKIEIDVDAALDVESTVDSALEAGLGL